MALRLAIAAPLIAIDKQLVHTLFFVHDRVSARFVNPSHVASFPASSFDRSCITLEAEKQPKNNEARSLSVNRAASAEQILGIMHLSVVCPYPPPKQQ